MIQQPVRRNYVKINHIMDMIQTSINEEQHYEDLQDYVLASEAGLRTWLYLKQFMALLQVSSLYELEHETIFDLLYWANVLTMNLHNATLKNPDFFQQYFLFCKEYVTMHVPYLEKNVRNLGHIRSALAGCYLRQGEVDRCDQLFEQWLKQEPDWGWGWIGWSDSYYLFSGKRNKDKKRAQQILEKGLAVPSVRNRDEIKTRLQELEHCIA